MSILMSNGLLEAAEKQVESRLTPGTQASYLRIVVAGMHAGMANGSKMLRSLQDSKDPIADCATGALSLCFVLRKSSKGNMPIPAMIYAGHTLMLKALDFCDQSGIVKIGRPELVRATQIYSNIVLKRFGITKSMLNTAMTRVHAITQDPAAMARIQAKTGIGGNHVAH